MSAIPKSTLLILEGPEAGKSVPIGRLPFTIGRLPASDLVLADHQVSRQHARLEAGEEGPEIVDLRSRNGLFVNRARVERHRLSPGDRIRIGATVLVFEVAEELPAGISDPDAERMVPETPLSPADGPTAIRDLVDLESVVASSSARHLEEMVKLFRSTLPPQGVAPQILDVFFQTFAPDRAEIVWDAGEKVETARSRKQGKKCPPFPLPPDAMAKGATGAAAVRTKERSVLIAPLRAYGEVKGWIYGERPPEVRPYSSAEAEPMESFAVTAGAVLERSTVLLDQRRLRERIRLMEKHLSPEIARMIAAHSINIEESLLSVEEKEVTILFSDIEGFTPLSERLSAPEVAALLNEYFQRMVDVVSANGGMVNKFIGDAVMALFGAPKSQGNDAVNAVTAALQMIDVLKQFWAQIDPRKRFNIRIGVNTGRVVAGNIGSEKKMEYTVLGDQVNMASRYQSVSPANVVTIGPRTAELVGDRFRLEKVSDVKVKGKSGFFEVYRVLGVA